MCFSAQERISDPLTQPSGAASAAGAGTGSLLGTGRNRVGSRAQPEVSLHLPPSGSLSFPSPAGRTDKQLLPGCPWSRAAGGTRRARPRAPKSTAESLSYPAGSKQGCLAQTMSLDF